ncbi:hypothetical protein D3C76_1742650 [compost metagenome]
MLEEVGVQALLGDLGVRLHVVGEFLDLQLHTFFGQHGFDEVEDFRVRHRRGGDVQGVRGLGQRRGKRRSGGEGGKQFFHR